MRAIVVDDGGTDGLVEHLRGRSFDFELVVVRQVHSGVSAARNTGYRACDGKWVMFVDADDWLLPGALGPLLKAATDTRSDICFSDYVARDGKYEKLRVNINSSESFFDSQAIPVFQWLCLANIGFGRKKNVGLLGAPWAKLYSRAFLEQAFGGRPLFVEGVRRAQDVVFNLEAFSAADRFGYYHAPTYVYERSEASFSHRRNDSFLTDVRVLVDMLERTIKRLGALNLEPAIQRICVVLYGEAVRRMGSHGWAEQARAARSLAAVEPFRSGISMARFRDCTAVGVCKLLCLKFGWYGAYVAGIFVKNWLRRALRR